MRLVEIAAFTPVANTHPYVAVVEIDPVQLFGLEQVVEDRPELRMGRVRRDRPDVWSVEVHCASRAVAEAFEDSYA